MADKTTNFGMNLPLDSEFVDQELYNENFEILDTEVARRITAVNGIEAGDDGGVVINEVPFAKQIASDKQQQSSEEYTFRTTGGEASLEDGPATLVGIYGRSVHTGIINEVFNMTVTLGTREEPEEGEEPEEPITATIDKDTFIEYVMDPASITVQLLYTDMWSANPSLYGITVTGTPVSGDAITVDYVRADRGTITPSNPTTFISTGWNLYNDDVGYARVKKYSDTYNFIVGGTYEALKFSDTYDGVRQDITVSSNRFSIPSDGYVWVTGGNAITTCIYMTWSDWTSGYEGEWKAYEESVVDFSEDAETAFPYGMCQVGPIVDEIDFSMKRMIRRIDRVAYSAATIEVLINSGTAYDADSDYIYYVLAEPVVTSIDLSNIYIANDHGLEMVDGDIAPLILTMYGENLVEKLSSDVLTISHQTLSASQQAQARMNIGVAGKIIPVISGTTNNSGYAISSGEYFEANGVLYKATAAIPKDNAWSSSATAQGDTVHGALNDGLNALNSKVNPAFAWETNVDMNSYTTPGWYAIAGYSANAPFNADANWSILNVVGRSDTIRQFLYGQRGSLFTRAYQSNAWSSWIEHVGTVNEFNISIQNGASNTVKVPLGACVQITYANSDTVNGHYVLNTMNNAVVKISETKNGGSVSLSFSYVTSTSTLTISNGGNWGCTAHVLVY